MIIRYAEILLWKAEALIELNQDLEGARSLINQVRNRAKASTYVTTLDGSTNAANYSINPYSSVGWNQDFARKALRFERRLEFALEGHHFFDLVRWGDAINVLSPRGYQNKHRYFPIPTPALNGNPNLVQNPEWP